MLNLNLNSTQIGEQIKRAVAVDDFETAEKLMVLKKEVEAKEKLEAEAKIKAEAELKAKAEAEAKAKSQSLDDFEGMSNTLKSMEDKCDEAANKIIKSDNRSPQTLVMILGLSNCKKEINKLGQIAELAGLEKMIRADLPEEIKSMLESMDMIPRDISDDLRGDILNLQQKLDKIVEEVNKLLG